MSAHAMSRMSALNVLAIVGWETVKIREAKPERNCPRIALARRRRSVRAMVVTMAWSAGAARRGGAGRPAQLWPQSVLVARRAPSARDLSLAQATVGWISVDPANVAKPQSAPAM